MWGLGARPSSPCALLPRAHPLTLHHPPPGLAFLAGAQLASSTKLKPTLAKLQEYPLLNAGVKFSVVFPLAYHYAGGLRHVMWDNVKGQSMAVNKQTGLAAVAFATVAGLAASAIEVER